MRIFIIGYEPTHADALKRCSVQLKNEGHEAIIVTFDQELEWLLAQANISFISSREYRRCERVQNLECAERFVSEIRTRHLSVLNYRGVALEAVLGFPLQVYFQKWFYFAEALGEMLERETPDKVYICAPYFSPQIEENTFLHYNNEAPVICLRTLCVEREVPCEVIAALVTPRPQKARIWDFILCAGLNSFNVLMGLLQREGDIRIFASEYWRHIAPVFEELPHSTLTLYDRKEIKHLPIRTIIRHRIRFVHASKHLSSDALERVNEAVENLNTIWKSQKVILLRELRTYHGCDLSTVLSVIINDLMTYQLRPILIDVERMYALFQRVHPHIVLLRVSMGIQSHFPILAHVARELGIPAIELQHGLELLAPGSLSRRHLVEYMALYGELVRQEMLHAAPGPKFSVVGSLDFDTLYAAPVLPESDENTNEEIVCIAPDIFFSAAYDTYDAYAYFCAVAAAARTAGMRVRIKLRNASSRQFFYREAVRRAFEGIPHTVLQDKPIADVCRGAQLAVSCYSTAALELLICGLPTVLAAITPAEDHFTSFHFSQYVQAGALKIARTSDELSSIIVELSRNKPARRTLQKGIKRFLNSAYAFDGHAARRLAALMRALAKK